MAERGSLVFELTDQSLRVFQKAVTCLNRVSRSTAIIFRAEELVLHGADEGHSTALQYAFKRQFFRSTPSQQECGASEVCTVVVPTRALAAAVSGSKQRVAQSESLVLWLKQNGLLPSGIGSDQRLVLEFRATFGGLVRHSIPLLDERAFLPGEPVVGPHIVAMEPALLGRVLGHCAPGKGSCDEVTFLAVPQEGVRVKSYDLLKGPDVPRGGGNCMWAEVLVEKTDLEAHHLDHSGGEATFSGKGLREFSRMVKDSSKDLEGMGLLTGCALLELRFGNRGNSVVARLVMKSPAEANITHLEDVSAVLITATRDFSCKEEEGTPLASTQPAAAPAETGRRPQPRQGPKRRAVATSVELADAFDAFPDPSCSQMSQSQQAPGGGWPAAPQAQAAAPARIKLEQTPRPGWSTSSPAAYRHQPAAAPVSPWPQQSPSAPRGPQQPQAPLPVATSQQPRPFQVQPPHVQTSWQQPMPAPAPVTRPAAPQAVLGQPQGVPAAPGSHWWQGGQAPPAQLHVASGSQPVRASLLPQAEAFQQQREDSDDDLIGEDPDEVAFARRGEGVPETADWFDVEKLW